MYSEPYPSFRTLLHTLMQSQHVSSKVWSVLTFQELQIESREHPVEVVCALKRYSFCALVHLSSINNVSVTENHIRPSKYKVFLYTLLQRE